MRREYKYLVPNNQLDHIRRSISPFCSLDRHTPKDRRDYSISSVYFDSTSSSSYIDKIEGIGQRRKLRIRVYNPLEQPETVFLEIKRKREQFIAKTRFKMEREKLQQVLNGIATANQPKELRSFLYYHRLQRMHPVVNVVYEREAYVGNYHPGLRITLDMNLRCNATNHVNFSETKTRQVFRNHSILEVKFERQVLPQFVTRLISRHRIERQALSKFTMSMDVLHAASGRIA